MSIKDLKNNFSINTEIKQNNSSFILQPILKRVKNSPELSSPDVSFSKISSPSLPSPIFSNSSNFFDIPPPPPSTPILKKKSISPPPPPPPPQNIEMADLKKNTLRYKIRNINFKRLRNKEEPIIRAILKKSYNGVYHYIITDYEYDVKVILYSKLKIIRINNIVFNIDKFINFDSIKMGGKNMNSITIDIGKKIIIKDCSIEIVMKIYEIIKARLRI
jgi:hypothetical protein